MNLVNCSFSEPIFFTYYVQGMYTVVTLQPQFLIFVFVFIRVCFFLFVDLPLAFRLISRCAFSDAFWHPFILHIDYFMQCGLGKTIPRVRLCQRLLFSLLKKCLVDRCWFRSYKICTYLVFNWEVHILQIFRPNRLYLSLGPIKPVFVVLQLLKAFLFCLQFIILCSYSASSTAHLARLEGV